MAKKNTTNHRKDIKELNDRKVFLEDKNRKAAVKKRHNSGKRTARENIQDICDVATFRRTRFFAHCCTKRRKSRRVTQRNAC